MCPQPSHEIARANEAVKRQYAAEAPGYDSEMDFWERRLIGADHRPWACSRARGRTLEVAIGTGLNLPHYPPDVELTGLDLSAEMLALAEARARDLSMKVDLREGDAQDLPFEDGTFDTVVCTYALCSIPDDAVAVSEMSRTVKPGGRLILVDHVRSTFPPLYWLQRAYELMPLIGKRDNLTRRPAAHVFAGDFVIEAHDRLRAGIIERLVARK